MAPTAQEMASALHAWRGAAARSRSTAKGGLGSPAGAVTAHLPALQSAEVVAAGLPLTAEPREPAGS